MSEELLAGPRDANFVASPGRAYRRHIAVTEDGQHYFARCAPGRHLRGPRCIPLIETMLCPAEQVHPGGRCQQPGCRVKWPAEYVDRHALTPTPARGGNARPSCTVSAMSSSHAHHAHQEET